MPEEHDSSTIRRLEEKHNDLRDDVQDIRGGLMDLTKEIHAIGLDLRGFSTLVQSMLTRLEERDKQHSEQSSDYKEIFTRFGTRLDELEKRIRVTEKDSTRLATIEKAMYYIVAGIGSLVLFYIQQHMTGV